MTHIALEYIFNLSLDSTLKGPFLAWPFFLESAIITAPLCHTRTAKMLSCLHGALI
jgi:hypothetical protein